MSDFSFQSWKSENPDSWFSCVPGKNGFLPVGDPLDVLPDEYNKLTDILNNMKIYQKEEKKGYLEIGNLQSKVMEELPLYDVSKIEDKQLLAALHRDFCFLASAYSLEPCHISLMNSENNDYGEARSILPPKISIPLLELAKKNNTFPWLDYAYGYGLNNAVLTNKENYKDFKCYKTIRTFNGHDSEEGFINVHVAMVAQSGELLQSQQNCLQNIYQNNRTEFNNNLQKHFSTFYNIVDTLQTMWRASNFKDYLSFRTFIMGQIGNDKCYPKEEIIFNKGQGDNYEYETHAYRGETGAQDSIVPSVDSFLQLSYPKNKLTEYLFDLRKYRPKDHQAYIDYMKQNSEKLQFKEYCLQDARSCILLLKNLNCLRMFRKKHWNLTKKYIIDNTKHPVATGGTPITTWLPNQLGATLEYMDEIVKALNDFHSKNEVPENDIEFFNNIKVELSDHIQSIMDEVKSMQQDFNEQNHDDFLKRT